MIPPCGSPGTAGNGFRVTALGGLDPRRSPNGRCVGFEDGQDGFIIHAVACHNAGRAWLHGADCLGYSTWRGTWPTWATRRLATVTTSRPAA